MTLAFSKWFPAALVAAAVQAQRPQPSLLVGELGVAIEAAVAVAQPDLWGAVLAGKDGKPVFARGYGARRRCLRQAAGAESAVAIRHGDDDAVQRQGHRRQVGDLAVREGSGQGRARDRAELQLAPTAACADRAVGSTAHGVPIVCTIEGTGDRRCLVFEDATPGSGGLIECWLVPRLPR